MKVKSLLFAAAAMLALGASAQAKLIVPDIDLNEEANQDKVIDLPITVQFAEGAENMTNCQLVVVFPEGVKPAQDEYGSYCFEGDDVAKAGRAAAIAFSDNLSVEEKYPQYTIVGANLTKTPTYTNPMNFLHLNVIADKNAPAGQFKFYMKYNTKEDQSIQIGNAVPGENEGEIIYTWADDTQLEGGHIIPLPVAVNDINTAKAVSSVKYYNAAGMASDTAFDGINIVVTKYADGSQSTAKVVK